MLAVENLTKHFEDGDRKRINVLDGLTLSVQAGEFVSVYGPSGSGKTTLLELIAGFQTPDAGTVSVAGQIISHLTPRAHADYLLRVLGIVGQPHELMPGASAQENAALKLLRDDALHANKRIVPLLEQLGLADRMKQRASKLSMGERQRVQIAQALSMDPKLVLADEPTGHLDPSRSREVLALLAGLCRERETAVLLATHDSQAVAYADRALILHKGHLESYEPETALPPMCEVRT
ncbi:MAG TPA: ABC transporter ATP-binding protein [Solirubrobacteraceae bacterium]